MEFCRDERLPCVVPQGGGSHFRPGPSHIDEHLASRVNHHLRDSKCRSIYDPIPLLTFVDVQPLRSGEAPSHPSGRRVASTACCQCQHICLQSAGTHYPGEPLLTVREQWKWSLRRNGDERILCRFAPGSPVDTPEFGDPSPRAQPLLCGSGWELPLPGDFGHRGLYIGGGG